MNKLVISIKSIYGNELIYPVNEAAKALCRIAGKKTLSKNDVIDARKLGFVVELAPVDLDESTVKAIVDIIAMPAA